MLSIIIPFHNEEQNLRLLYKELTLSLLKLDYEAVYVDDGSVDQGYAVVKKITEGDKRVLLIRHRTRMGKGVALNSGVAAAKGDIFIFLDADLQDDPKEIPRLLQKIEEGYDLVNGARIERKDNIVIKIYSKLFNQFLQLFLKSPYSDINCGFKALRRSVLDEIVLYGNNFRFLPLAAYHHGFKVAEVKVNNRPRKYGKSKFGASKLFIGMIDSLTAYFLYQFSERPLHFFGSIGGVFFSVGFVIAFILSIERLFFGVLLYRRPALLFAILLIIVGIQIVMTGIIGELIVYVNKKKS